MCGDLDGTEVSGFGHAREGEGEVEEEEEEERPTIHKYQR